MSIATASQSHGIRSAESHSSDPKNLWLWILYLASFAVIIAFLVDGYSYYLSPYTDRPHHELYRALRPAGTRGLGFGVVGATMMILMLLYTLRKRTKLLGKLGSRRFWLQLHIYLGIVGPLLIVLHTSFKVQGLVAVGFWSMVIVAMSGYFGRYLYRKIPRNIDGDELTLQQLENLGREFTQKLRSEYNLDDESIAWIDKLGEGVTHETGTFRVLFEIMTDDFFQYLTYRRLHRRLARKLILPASTMHHLMKLIHRRAALRREMIVQNQVQELFHYWHVFHKPFAIVMYAIMTVHIVVAFWTGYTWIF